MMRSFENLMADPQGWLYGEPSALYSNVAAPPAARESARVMQRRESAAAATAAMEPLAPLEAPLEPAMAAEPLTGSVVPVAPARAASGKKGKKKGRRARAAERVPPSSPEELEAARRGAWDYTAGRIMQPSE